MKDKIIELLKKYIIWEYEIRKPFGNFGPTFLGIGIIIIFAYLASVFKSYAGVLIIISLILFLIFDFIIVPLVGECYK